jgi:hypothetical protein
MIGIGIRFRVKASSAFIILIVIACVAMHCPANAQNWGSNVFGFGAFESIFGPIIPPGGLGASFRSEISVGLGTAVLDKAMLESASIPGGKIDLVAKDNSNELDTHPMRYDVRANVRFWRFGARGAYSNFESRGIDRFDFSGMILGGDFDVVQFQCFALGACADFYFIDPTFTGPVKTNNGVPIVDQVAFKGDRPVTVGGYVRYVPPEILGFPVHFEGYVKAPYKKNVNLTSLTASLVFRPQVYRFDAFAKVTFEKNYMKFGNIAEVQTPGVPQNWELNMNWKLFSLDLGVYF